jgi:hypothetical protein
MNPTGVIANTTADIRRILDNQIVQFGGASGHGNAAVRVASPDRSADESENQPTLNLFLFRVSPNTSWRGFGPQAGASDVPQIALDLHYLLSAHSVDEYLSESLLEVAIVTLLSEPLAKRLGDVPDRAEDGSSGVTPVRNRQGQNDVAGSGGPERLIRIEFTSLEDSVRLWTALQAKLRPSVMFRVSPVVVNGAEAGGI